MRGTMVADAPGQTVGPDLIMLESVGRHNEVERVARKTTAQHQGADAFRGLLATGDEQAPARLGRQLVDEIENDVGPRDSRRHGFALQARIGEDRHAVGGDAPGVPVGSLQLGIAPQADDVVEIGCADDAGSHSPGHGLAAEDFDEIGTVQGREAQTESHRDYLN